MLFLRTNSKFDLIPRFYSKPKNTNPSCVSHFYLSAIWGARHTYVLMSFLGNLTASLLRVNLSEALVAMVKEGK